MNAFGALLEAAGLAGEFQGSNVLYEPPTDEPVTSQASGRLHTQVSGRMLRFDYRWMLRNDAHEGTLLLGCDPAGRVTGGWGDSWHQGSGVMALTGQATSDAISVRGSYAAPPGPDWGWRIDLSLVDDEGALLMEMWNVTPDGHEAIAVEMSLSR